MQYSYYTPRRPAPPRRRRLRARLWLLIGLILAAAFVGYRVFATPGGSLKNGLGIIKKVPPPPQPTIAEGRYLFNGTVVWARRVQQWSTKADGKIDYAYPFSGLASFNRQQYDAWTGDLECASGVEEVPLAKQEGSLIFNCRPEFLPEAAKYFNFFNLANNHSDNLGADGFEETRRHLAENGIQAFGNYEPGKLQDICEVVALPVRLQMSDKTEKKASLPVAFCAWHYFYRLPLPGEIEHMKQYAAVMPVFAFLQMGVEYKPFADDMQKSVARRIIDAGASFVVANSPHWVQDTEAYGGKLIAYSTGNFIFDQQYNAEVTRSVSIDATFKVKYDDNLAKWLALGESCRALHDNCFDQALAQKLTTPAFSLSYEVVAGDNSGKLTKKAGPAIQQAVEERTKWTRTKQQLEETAQKSASQNGSQER